jgi:hypothetical protein
MPPLITYYSRNLASPSNIPHHVYSQHQAVLPAGRCSLVWLVRTHPFSAHTQPLTTNTSHGMLLGHRARPRTTHRPDEQPGRSHSAQPSIAIPHTHRGQRAEARTRRDVDPLRRRGHGRGRRGVRARRRGRQQRGLRADGRRRGARPPGHQILGRCRRDQARAGRLPRREPRDGNPATGPHDGAVLHVSSMGGWMDFPASSFYNASKFAVEGWTEAVAEELPVEWNSM